VQGSEDTQRLRSSQDQEGPKSETLADDDEMKHNTEKGLEEIAEK
jgi:hypothetical protein